MGGGCGSAGVGCVRQAGAEPRHAVQASARGSLDWREGSDGGEAEAEAAAWRLLKQVLLLPLRVRPKVFFQRAGMLCSG